MRPGLLRPRKGALHGPAPGSKPLGRASATAAAACSSLLCNRRPATASAYRLAQGGSAIPHRHGPSQGQGKRPASYTWGRAALTCARRCGLGDAPPVGRRPHTGPRMIVGRCTSAIVSARADGPGPAHIVLTARSCWRGRALAGRMARAQPGGATVTRRNGWTRQKQCQSGGHGPPAPQTNADRIPASVRLRPASFTFSFPVPAAL